jgi:hypothetical protein
MSDRLLGACLCAVERGMLMTRQPGCRRAVAQPHGRFFRNVSFTGIDYSDFLRGAEARGRLRPSSGLVLSSRLAVAPGRAADPEPPSRKCEVLRRSELVATQFRAFTGFPKLRHPGCGAAR